MKQVETFSLQLIPYLKGLLEASKTVIQTKNILQSVPQEGAATAGGDASSYDSLPKKKSKPRKT